MCECGQDLWEAIDAKDSAQARGAGGTLIFTGAGLLVVGLLVTLGSLAMASRSGVVFFAYGAIGTGAGMLGLGLWLRLRG